MQILVQRSTTLMYWWREGYVDAWSHTNTNFKHVHIFEGAVFSSLCFMISYTCTQAPSIPYEWQSHQGLAAHLAVAPTKTDSSKLLGIPPCWFSFWMAVLFFSMCWYTIPTDRMLSELHQAVPSAKIWSAHWADSTHCVFIVPFRGLKTGPPVLHSLLVVIICIYLFYSLFMSFQPIYWPLLVIWHHLLRFSGWNFIHQWRFAINGHVVSCRLVCKGCRHICEN